MNDRINYSFNSQSPMAAPGFNDRQRKRKAFVMDAELVSQTGIRWQLGAQFV
jgi:hypothetical protein